MAVTALKRVWPFQGHSSLEGQVWLAWSAAPLRVAWRWWRRRERCICWVGSVGVTGPCGLRLFWGPGIDSLVSAVFNSKPNLGRQKSLLRYFSFTTFFSSLVDFVSFSSFKSSISHWSVFGIKDPTSLTGTWIASTSGFLPAALVRFYFVSFFFSSSIRWHEFGPDPRHVK